MADPDLDEIERKFDALGLGTEERRMHFRRLAGSSNGGADSTVYFQRVTNSDEGPSGERAVNA